MNLFDHPRITSMLFYPRTAQPGSSRIPRTQDGTYPVDDTVIGYRLYQPESARVIIVYFHGNGEVAADYDDIVPFFFKQDAALLIIDFRGYGWSGGSPLTSTLLPDALALVSHLAKVLDDKLMNLPRLVMGRSLGSAPAIALADEHPDLFKALIIESGFADAPSVFRRLGIPIPDIIGKHMPLGNTQRLARVGLPLLVIHGEADQLLPVDHGQRLYDASPSERKHFLKIPRAGHNDLLYHGAQIYFDAIRRLTDEVC